MKITALSLGFGMLFAPPVHAQNTIAQAPEVASNIKLLEAWIESQMAYRSVPGMSVGVVYDQTLIWARGFGYADVEKKIPATPATIYRMASVTKTFTATAIMQLRDAGKLSLDDPVVKHLPWFKVKSRFHDAPAVNIRHLLTHTSGLPREAAYPYWTDNFFPPLEQIMPPRNRLCIVRPGNDDGTSPARSFGNGRLSFRFPSSRSLLVCATFAPCRPRTKRLAIQSRIASTRSTAARATGRPCWLWTCSTVSSIQAHRWKCPRAAPCFHRFAD